MNEERWGMFYTPAQEVEKPHWLFAHLFDADGRVIPKAFSPTPKADDVEESNPSD